LNNTQSTQPPVSAPDAGSAQGRGGRKQLVRRSAVLQNILVPLLAVLTGLIIGAIVIIVTDPAVVAAFRRFFEAPGAAFAAAWKSISTAYGALFYGSFGSVPEMVRALGSGDPAAMRQAFYPITESLTASTPYIFAGLGVALGFRAGLFNIGAEGQFFMGSLGAAFVGYSLVGWPLLVHLPLAILGGFLVGAIWGAIPGWLKAKTGGHEVVNTIMMNYIAYRLSDWLINGPMKAPGFRPVTPHIQASAELPRLFGDPLRFNVGFFLALAAAVLVWWLLFKTTLGYEIRTVGQNPRAARYAGISVPRIIIITMALSGALAGLAAPMDILGVIHFMPNAFASGYGFDAIALALLGNSHPAGVVVASLLFGALRAGASNMQGVAKIPIDITSILQGLIIVFIAAPAIIRAIYRLRGLEKGEGLITTRGWGQM